MMDKKNFKINKESIDRLFPKTDPMLDYLTSMGYKSPVTTFIEHINTDLRTEELKAVMNATVRLGVEVDEGELLKALQYDRKQYEQGYRNGYDAGLNAHTWIPVTERLPEENGTYLVIGKSGTPHTSHFYNTKTYNGREYRWHFSNRYVRYWQPLPEPPIESEDTEEEK